MEEQPKKSNVKDAIYILIILLLAGGVAFFGYQKGQTEKLLKECGALSDGLSKDKDELNEILKNTGLIADAENKQVKENLLAMLQEYDNIESSNEDMQDSIASQKQKISDLLLELDNLNAQKKKDYGKIYKLQKESETLREIMKGYIHTIDSLNTLNIGLKNTIVKKDEEIDGINKNLANVKDKNKQLENTVAVGSVLQSTGLVAYAIKVKNSGTQTETNRANRADQIKACFTVIENKIAKAENKTLYMRIIDPSGSELVGEKPVFFNMAGKDGQACIARQINYQNQNTDVCIYYELEKEIAEGTYIVEIYCEGNKIGSTSFALK